MDSRIPSLSLRRNCQQNEPRRVVDASTVVQWHDTANGPRPNHTAQSHVQYRGPCSLPTWRHLLSRLWSNHVAHFGDTDSESMLCHVSQHSEPFTIERVLRVHCWSDIQCILNLHSSWQSYFSCSGFFRRSGSFTSYICSICCIESGHISIRYSPNWSSACNI